MEIIKTSEAIERLENGKKLLLSTGKTVQYVHKYSTLGDIDADIVLSSNKPKNIYLEDDGSILYYVDSNTLGLLIGWMQWEFIEESISTGPHATTYCKVSQDTKHMDNSKDDYSTTSTTDAEYVDLFYDENPACDCDFSGDQISFTLNEFKGKDIESDFVADEHQDAEDTPISYFQEQALNLCRKRVTIFEGETIVLVVNGESVPDADHVFYVDVMDETTFSKVYFSLFDLYSGNKVPLKKEAFAKSEKEDVNPSTDSNMAITPEEINVFLRLLQKR